MAKYQKWNKRTCSLIWNPEVQSIVSRTYLEADGGRVEIRAEQKDHHFFWWDTMAVHSNYWPPISITPAREDP